MNEIPYSNILGSGRPLLILHGFLGMSDNWKTLGTQYAENGLEVHLIDQRNHGKSFHSENFNYDYLSDDLERYMHYHKLDHAMLIGHSMGGKTVMQFVCDHPEMVGKLLVADISSKYYPPHHQAIINGLNALDFEKIASRSQAENELARYISDLGTRQFLLKSLYWVEKGKLGFRFNLDVLSQRLHEIGENISTSSLYEGPTLFLKGDRSEYVTADDLPEIRRHFPKAVLDSISNSGHWLHAENPQEFFEKSLAFFNS